PAPASRLAPRRGRRPPGRPRHRPGRRPEPPVRPRDHARPEGARGLKSSQPGPVRSGRECPMRRRLIGLLALALLAAACTAGGGGDSKTAATVDPHAPPDPLTPTLWSNFSGREGKVTTTAPES